MLLSLPVLVLLCCSTLVCALALLAGGVGVTVATGWDPEDRGRRQLARERRSLLVESSLGLVLAWQMLFLVFFVATADRLHALLPGAMCAAGTLNASHLGYPSLALAALAFLLSGLWLLVHKSSPAAASVGLVRAKYFSIAPLGALLLVENGLLFRFFGDLDPAVMTSCCATVFAAGSTGLGGGLASLPVLPTRVAFFVLLALTLLAGGSCLVRRRPPTLFSILAVLSGALGLVAIVVWVAPAFYALPSHHCPFCLLAADHYRVGYLLYLALAVGVLTGSGSGLVHALRRLDPLGSIRQGVERRLCRTSMIGLALFALISSWPSAAAGLRALRTAVGP